MSPNETEIVALNVALSEAMDGQLQMKGDGWTVTATVNLRAVAERLYVRGVRASDRGTATPTNEAPNAE